MLVEDVDGVPRRKFRLPPPVESTRGREGGVEKSDLDLFENDPPPLGMGRMRRQENQDAEYKSFYGMRPKTGTSGGQVSTESFTIDPA